ncbi:sporulation protein [Methanosarcinaceae archaeon]|nr:sporulation protein [Methanosarcinaceae archaeon]MBQ3620513.1 sporulation protein [Methanosarcinaceae archaeon]
MTVQDIVKEVSNELEKVVSTKTVVGEPIEAAGRTIIPITKISVGFGCGGLEGAAKGNPKEEGAGEPGAKAYGGGGGAGARIEPVAFIVMTEDKTEILTIKETQLENELARAISMIPTLIEKLKTLKKEEPKPKRIAVSSAYDDDDD